MPYVRCPACGLAAYTASGYSGRDQCPRCGEELPERVSADPRRRWASATLPRGRARSPIRLGVAEPVQAATSRDDEPGDGPLALALGLAREQLDMDLALLTEVVGGRQVVRQIEGEHAWLGVGEGDSFPLDETYCERLLDGRIGSIVRDAQHDVRVADLESTREVGIGAYIGVPLRVDDMRLYVLCCVAREARPGLTEADVRFLKGLGETVMAELNGAA